MTMPHVKRLIDSMKENRRAARTLEQFRAVLCKATVATKTTKSDDQNLRIFFAQSSTVLTDTLLFGTNVLLQKIMSVEDDDQRDNLLQTVNNCVATLSFPAMTPMKHAMYAAG